MAETSTNMPVQDEPRGTQAPARRDMFGSLQQEISRIFEEFDRGFPGLGPRLPMATMQPFLTQGRAMAPSVDLVEKDDRFEIHADLPGLDQKDIEIKLAGDTLTIKGERKEEKEEKRKDYYLSERQFGMFQRAFRIPENIDAEKIDARFDNGVLTIDLPKRTDAKKVERQIKIG